MPNKINWKAAELNISRELVSSDNRWHISMTETETHEADLFLSNYDLLLAPHGSGDNYRDCFESFIRDCNAYMLKLQAVRQEAAAQLQERLATAVLKLEITPVLLTVIDIDGRGL